MPEDPKLTKIKAILGLVNDGLSMADFTKAFKEVLMFVQKTRDDLTAKIDARLAQIRNGADGRNGVDGKSIVGPKGDRGEPGPIGRSIFGGKGETGADGKDGSPDTGEQIVDKINGLPTEDDVDKIDAAHIKNLPKAVEGITRVIGGHGPLWGLSDVDVSGITSGQSIKWDGVRWIPFTPTGANTAVYNEVVAGATNTFTLANTPVAGTVRVYALGQRLVPTTDYTILGAIITTVSSWSAGQITSDYEYV